jgi:ubiquinone/menaquinone biosynthesis C-methylase UbiE
MNATYERWQQAQHAEGEFWWGLARSEADIRRVLEDNRQVAEQVEAWLPVQSQRALEIGVGGLGVGTLGFLKKIPVRVGIDPLPLSELSCSETLRGVVGDLRAPIQFRLSPGERTPFPDASFDLVLCCNVLDHVHDPAIVLNEVCRVLRPSGYFYLFVDVFSLAGLVKWKAWTQRKRKDEILVRAHPHRFRENKLHDLLQHAGLRIVRENSRSVWEKLFAHSMRLAILAQKG